MKKISILLCCVMLLLSLIPAGYCDNENWKTKTWFNGHFIIDSIKNGKSSTSYSNAMYYCFGLIDAMKAIDINSKLPELYGENTNETEIFEAMCRYYQNNPTERHKRAIEVLLSGAK